MLARVLKVLVGSCVLCTASLFAQFEGTAQAKAIFEQGQIALRSDHIEEAIADFQKAMKIDPDFAQAHEEYISTYSRAPYLKLKPHKTHNPDELTEQEETDTRVEVEERRRSLVRDYEALAKVHPKLPIYLWALGRIYDESDSSRRESYCRRAVEIDNHFAPGYECLSTISYDLGAQINAIEYQKKVVELEPRNPYAMFIYSFYLSGDPAAYKATTEEMIARFPNSAESAQALYWYAENQPTDGAQIEAFERLRSLFPPAKFDWSTLGTMELFALYDRAEPAKAHSLAREMQALLPKDEEWAAYATYSNEVYSAEQSLQDKPAEALTTLASVKAPTPIFDMGRTQVLQARALDLLGRTTDAYSFIVSSYAKHPTDQLRASLDTYAKKLGKSLPDEDSTVWSSMSANSSPAIPISLPNSTNGNLVSLSSYRGHVVIVEFWFPRCGPCRQAFPYVQQALSTFKDHGVVVLAINEEEGQDAEVIPFLKSKQYDFIPLKATHKWASGQYGVNSAPSTFLVGADGRIYFHPRFFDRFEEHTSELEIEELLKHAG